MTELIDAINELIAAPSGDIDRLEHTLTDGYAHALSLEAEAHRIERRLADATRELGREGSTVQLDEVADLARRLDANRAELERLRSLLASLRRVADAVRSAA
ncbi:MAG TPA: hypothetical protein VFA97_12655 [Gaiellaceae bacterium]|nr:hypothetical protein [Gaiellaceae bacterium]